MTTAEVKTIARYSDGARRMILRAGLDSCTVTVNPNRAIGWSSDWSLVVRLMLAGVLERVDYGPESYGDAAALIPEEVIRDELRRAARIAA